MKRKILFIIIYSLILISLVVYYHSISKKYEIAINNLNNYLIENNIIEENDLNKVIIELDKNKQTLLNNFNKILNGQDLTIDNIAKYEKKINEEYKRLKNENQSLNEEKKALQSQVQTLTLQYNKLIEKYTYKINNIKTINQYSLGYPTGCESAALTVLLNYHNINVSISDVVKNLKKGKKPYYENGILYGGNPYIEFVGNPKDSGSYGTYEKAIIDVANKYKSGIINATGSSLDEILAIVEEDRPVLAWVSMNMAVLYVSRSWIHKETGKKIKWIANEHALVIVGFNQNQVIVADSLSGSIKYFNRQVFENRYKAYGKRAVYY